MDSHIEDAIERLKMGASLAEQTYSKPLEVCYSGGKDSQVIVRLALIAGIDFTALHNHTTVDAPETVKTVRKTFSALEDNGIEAVISYPEKSMWRLIVEHRTPPTRLIRYCCKDLKERTSRGKFICTGVRRAESTKRRERATVDVLADRKDEREHFDDEVFLSNDNEDKRRIVERCVPKNAMCVNPIIDWSDAQVADFYFSECKIQNPLYMRGYSRVGCIGCPMASPRMRNIEFQEYPSYKRAYIRAFGKMLEERERRGMKIFDRWTDAQGVFDWLVQDKNLPGQMRLEFEDWSDGE